MAIRVALDDYEEGGKYAFIKEPQELNAGDRRAIKAAVPVTLGSDADGNSTLIYPGDQNERQSNALLARVVTDWNLNYELPNGDPSVFDKLEIGQLDRLYQAIEPHAELLAKTAINPAKPGTDPTSGSST